MHHTATNLKYKILHVLRNNTIATATAFTYLVTETLKKKAYPSLEPSDGETVKFPHLFLYTGKQIVALCVYRIHFHKTSSTYYGGSAVQNYSIKWLTMGLLLLFIGIATAQVEETAKSASVSEPAPDFELIDHTGKTHKLSDYKGKYVILEWVNFDCPFVRKHYRSGNMQALQKKFTKEGVVWLSICSSAAGKQGYFEGEELLERMKKENWSGTAYLIDEDGTVGKLYRAKTTPHMYIINPEGILVYAGAIDDKPSTDLEDINTATNYVVQAMAALKEGKKIEPAVTKSYGCSVKYK